MTVLIALLDILAFVGAILRRKIVAGHMFKNYERVLKVDGELGNKKIYDSRPYFALAETAMTERVKQAATDRCESGKTMFAP